MPHSANSNPFNTLHPVMNEAILRLHSQLEISTLLEEFACWLGSSVDFSALHFRHPTLGLFEFCTDSPAVVGYECSRHHLGELGTIYFLHHSPFTPAQQLALTEHIEALLHPLDHAVRYQGAVRQCDNLHHRLRIRELACANGGVIDSTAQLQGLSELIDKGGLHHALSSDALTIFYQPKIDIRSGEVRGVEALLRWYHAEQGLLSPEQFIPLAERKGQIQAVTRWVLNAVMRQCALWQQQGLALPVAVNLSGLDLEDSTLPDYLSQLLEAWDIPAEFLELEITETATIVDQQSSIATLQRIAAIGINIAIDDFGIGYSSLHRLKHLPINTIKIDKSFVMEKGRGECDHLFVDTITQLGHQLGMKVIAEGVDCYESWQRLLASGCDMAQGYHISQPLPAEAVPEWLVKSA